MIVARTPRLLVRRPRPDDLQDFLAYRNHPETLRLQPIEAMDEARAARFLQTQSELDDTAADCWIMFAIQRADAAGMVGEVGMYLDAATPWTGDVGWSVNPAFHGRGYAGEAARPLLDYAFGQRRLQQVTASMNAHNLASIRLCERLGMRRAGADAGEERHYVLLAADWRG